MFRTTLKSPRVTRQTPRCRLRPFLECLEDRVVPATVPNGWLVVCNFPTTVPTTTNQSGVVSGLLAFNPNNPSEQMEFSVGGDFSEPVSVTENPSNGNLYVADYNALGTGAVIQVSPDGTQTLIATGGPYINGPNVVSFLNGFLYVADIGDGTGSFHNIVKIDPVSHAQTLVPGSNKPGNSVMETATGAVLGGGDIIYYTDEQGNSNSPFLGELWSVNVTTGLQQVLGSGQYFDHPVDMTQAPDGNLLIVNTGNPHDNTSGSLFEFNPISRTRALVVPSFGDFSGTNSVGVAAGMTFVGNIADGALPARIYQVAGSSFTTVISGPPWSAPAGMVVYQTVTPVQNPTVTTLTSTPNPSNVGQNVTFTATVNPQGGSGTPTGTVEFDVNGTPTFTTALSPSRTATFNTSSLAPGNNIVTAIYSGDSNFLGSTSNQLTQTVVSPVSSTTTTVTSSANPAAVGATVTFTATVASSGGTPTGSVNFQIDNGNPFSVPLSNGQASFSINSLSAGNHTITANYPAQGSFGASSGSLVETITTAVVTTSTAVNSSQNPSVFGQPVTFTATVSSGSGTPSGGTVTFFDGSTNIGSNALSGGTATITVSNLSVATHNITANYSGSGNFSGSTSPVLQQVVNQATSSTTLASSANPSQAGQPVTFTATVSAVAPGAGTPTGTVTFTDTTTNSTLGTQSLSNGVATLTTSGLSTTTHNITAAYSGDTNFTTSSASLAQQVTPAPATSTTTTLTASPTSSVFGQPVTFTASVTGSGGTPTGTVTFFDNQTTQIGQGTLSGGTTSITVSSLPVGTHSITAVYGGDNAFAGSTSSALSFTVSSSPLTPTITAITSTPNPSTFGQGVTFTATVTGTGGTPTGTVTFLDGSTNIGSNTLDSGGTTSITVSNLSVGTHNITASYGGDNTFAASTSSTLTQVVNQATQGVQDGTILVASSHPGGPTGIIGVDRNTGTQFPVSTGVNFVSPMRLTEDDSGHNLYVSDSKASGTGAIIDVDPASGNQSVVTSGESINGPNAILFMKGHIYVADDGTPNIVDITPSNGKQTLITSGRSLRMPVGLAPAQGNNIYVLDQTAMGSGAIFVVDLHSGSQTVLSTDGFFSHPVDLSVDPQGNLIVINEGTAGSASLVRVNPQTGAQTLIAVHGTIVPGVTSGVVDQDGTVFVGAMTVGASPGQILTASLSTGAQSTFTSGQDLDVVEGVIVYHTAGGGDAPLPPGGSSAAALVLSATQTRSSAVAAPTSASTTDPSNLLSQTTALPLQSSDGGTDQGTLTTAAIDSVFADWANGQTQNTPLGDLALKGIN